MKSTRCPNAQLVKEHLQESAGFNGNLSDSDKVCFTCYKFHLLIVQQGKTFSSDSDLQAILDSIQHKINNAAKLSTLQQVCNLAMDKTVVHVGEELLQHSAILLPVVRDIFSQCHDEIYANEDNSEEFFDYQTIA